MSKLSSRKRRILVSILSFSLLAQQSLLPIMASTISGAGSVTGDSIIDTGGGNIYNLAPQAFNDGTGFRIYDNFDLSQGDIANLIFQWYNQSGKTVDFYNFVNLVRNQVNINGIVNSIIISEP